MGDADRSGRQRALPGLSRAAALAVVGVDAGLAATGTPWARRARWLTKPAVVPALARAGGRPASPAVRAALVGSWVGDVALLSRSQRGLLGGVGGFAAAHVAYLTAVRRFSIAGAAAGGAVSRGPGAGGTALRGADAGGTASRGAGADGSGPRGREAAVAAAYGAVLAAAGGVLWRRLDGPDQRRLRGPVLGYAALVTGLGAAAGRAGLRRGGPAGRALAAGGAVFVLSDGLVALSHFGGRRRPAVDAAVMVTYAGAQALLVRALTEPAVS